jgi:hypothetical protein
MLSSFRQLFYCANEKTGICLIYKNKAVYTKNRVDITYLFLAGTVSELLLCRGNAWSGCHT